jgi:hypothetical protein
MSSESRTQLARGMYEAFASGDRELVEQRFTEDLRFSSPLDVDLDRTGYFERCWPGAGRGHTFEFVRVIEAGDEVIVTYEQHKAEGKRGRNTEVLTFRGDRIWRVEVYFGWDVA